MTPGGVFNDKEMEMLLIEKKKSDKLSDLIVASGLGFVVRLNGQKLKLEIHSHLLIPEQVYRSIASTSLG